MKLVNTEEKPRRKRINSMLVSLHRQNKFASEKVVPESGAFILLTNSAIKTPEAKALIQRIVRIRPEVIIVTQSTFSNTYSTLKERASILSHLKDGKPAIFFLTPGKNNILRQESKIQSAVTWNNSLIQIIKESEAPLIPAYTKNSSLFPNIISYVNGINSQKKYNSLNSIKNHICIGRVLSLNENNENGIQDDSHQQIPEVISNSHQKALIESQSKFLLQEEIAILKNKGRMLFSIKNYEVFCVSPNEIGSFMYEIGRLREQTYREVGEGTNKSCDIDSFDKYYHQLFIWDNNRNELVGGYRIGFGGEIMKKVGLGGFYSGTLFSYQKDFESKLSKSLELGRSFIVKEYQRKSLPLFMLWKGILSCLINNPEYQYLLGPVSISADYSRTSKSLLIEFISRHYFNKEASKQVKAKNKVRLKHCKTTINSILSYTSNDIDKLDRIIKRFELNNSGVPVLIKKYLELQGKFLGFNLDPDFNNCIDGLFMVDVNNIPAQTVKAFSKGFTLHSEPHH